MTQALPTHWLALVGVVFLLGLKHGLDPDHLAAIDGLTRFNARSRPLLSRWSGLLFSAGHGVVVTAVAIAVATVALEWKAPRWLGDTGTWISIGFLLLLGVANLWSVWRTPRGHAVEPAGLRTRLFERLTRAEHPVLVAAVGAAFAISFDTISQAVLFSITGSNLAGWLFAALLGLIFTLGMIATDTLNGLWVSRLVRSADRGAAASRVMSLAIGVTSLAIAALAAARWLVPALDARVESLGIVLSVAVVAGVAISYLVAMRLAAREREAEPWNA
ncbi:MAG TPA: nickel transporter [Usitatibacter sp.]|jgi:high-affinity nickel-transport protein|nr:nickel transporter [Usitatibacter sp.]